MTTNCGTYVCAQVLQLKLEIAKRDQEAQEAGESAGVLSPRGGSSDDSGASNDGRQEREELERRVRDLTAALQARDTHLAEALSRVTTQTEQHLATMAAQVLVSLWPVPMPTVKLERPWLSIR